MRYIIYARKSIEDEDHQILSIESQLAELREFAAKEKLEIVKERGEPACGRAAPVVETSFHYGAGKLRGLVFAAAGGEMRSNYFQYRAP